MVSVTKRTYKERAASHPVAVARELLSTMDRKSTNLCVSVDVTTKESFLTVVDAVGPYCCCIKTHIDIISDFDDDLVKQLQALSVKHDFLIWEDRKFADIGNTVMLQYSSGVYKIASWAHLTNAHPIPGDGIVSGLSSIGLPLSRGLLLLAEMSSSGNLATGSYTASTVAMARRHPAFVMGFVAMHRVDEDESTAGGVDEDESTAGGVDVGQGADFVIMTPGVAMESKGDGMGQQYRTPEQVVGESGCDVIIVGRAIYGAGQGVVDEQTLKERCVAFRERGWKAYEDRLAN